MNEFEKGAALWEYGEHLAQRFDGDIGYSLYQLNNFYVEVMYNCGKNAITKFNSFSTITKLEPYLHGLDISGIIGMQFLERIYSLLLTAAENCIKLILH